MEYKHFNLSDFRCKCGFCQGENKIEHEFILLLDDLRDLCDFPFIVVSGYRCPLHPVEARKDKPGTHAQGIAADIRVSNGVQRRLLVDAALEMGCGGIGVANSFVHVDTRTSTPVIWTY